ncbi:MAG: sigma-54-dependent Fis family transcriptional regulator [Bryobacterales bacterium]|nr:sigma-54-dependent Fis family transcriptional regulator [Bryobacterales bacterium]
MTAESTDEEIVEVLKQAFVYRDRLAQTAVVDSWQKFLVGNSPAMRTIIDTIRLVAERRCTVLITGETGTGKEMVARALHAASNRSRLPLVAVNCSALPENLLEAELFGHVKGAFTGAINHRVGRFEQANNSTLFLDEIVDMPLDLQSKLLRVLQEREFQRLGSSDSVKVDARVVAACNVDPLERVAQGRFREDLYYRLNVVPIQVPALRDRLSDVPVLVQHFLNKVCRQEGIPVKRIADETFDRLCRYNWPGNVRQLENSVEKAVVLSGDRDTLYSGDFALPAVSLSKPPVSATIPTQITMPEDGIDFEQVVGTIERGLLEQALRRTNGNKKLAADMLRLKRTTLTAKLKSFEARVAC